MPAEMQASEGSVPDKALLVLTTLIWRSSE